MSVKLRIIMGVIRGGIMINGYEYSAQTLKNEKDYEYNDPQRVSVQKGLNNVDSTAHSPCWPKAPLLLCIFKIWSTNFAHLVQLAAKLSNRHVRSNI